MRIAIIVPIYNETPETVYDVSELVKLEGVSELIISNASNYLETNEAIAAVKRIHPEVRVVNCLTPQRAFQMNVAAKLAKADILWFVHADTIPPSTASKCLLEQSSGWGRFDVRFTSDKSLMKLVAFMMNLRSAISGICTGDQAIFVNRDLFLKVSGYPDIELMEDIALSKRLLKFTRPTRIRTPVTTSARRWETNGYLRTIVLMWALRFFYWLGVAPDTLARHYRPLQK